MFLIHLGFSIEDIRHMTMTDYMVYTDLAVAPLDADSDKSTGGVMRTAETVRKATQADIDNFFAF